MYFFFFFFFSSFLLLHSPHHLLSSTAGLCNAGKMYPHFPTPWLPHPPFLKTNTVPPANVTASRWYPPAPYLHTRPDSTGQASGAAQLAHLTGRTRTDICSSDESNRIYSVWLQWLMQFGTVVQRRRRRSPLPLTLSRGSSHRTED